MRIKFLPLTILLIAGVIFLPTYFNDYKFRYQLNKTVRDGLNYILPWQCTAEKEFKVSFCFPRLWSVQTETPKNYSLGKVLNVYFYTNMSSKFDEKAREEAGFHLQPIDKKERENATDTIRRYFGDKDNLLVIRKSDRKIGNDLAVYEIDDTVYKKKRGLILSEISAMTFIESKNKVWIYLIFYQNPTFDLRPYESKILKSLSFGE